MVVPRNFAYGAGAVRESGVKKGLFFLIRKKWHICMLVEIILLRRK